MDDVLIDFIVCIQNDFCYDSVVFNSIDASMLENMIESSITRTKTNLNRIVNRELTGAPAWLALGVHVHIREMPSKLAVYNEYCINDQRIIQAFNQMESRFDTEAKL